MLLTVYMNEGTPDFWTNSSHSPGTGHGIQKGHAFSGRSIPVTLQLDDRIQHLRIAQHEARQLSPIGWHHSCRALLRMQSRSISSILDFASVEGDRNVQYFIRFI